MEGAIRCDGDQFQICALWDDGCYEWSASTDCPDNGVCNPVTHRCGVPDCEDVCEAGATRCDEDGLVQSCKADSHGCLVWSESTACGDGKFCDSERNKCVTCNSACTAGQTRCSGNLVQTCDVDTVGCAFWGAPLACSSGQVCEENAGECVSCQSTCPRVGATRCSGNNVQTCQQSNQGCLTWSAPTACSAGVCNASTNSCQSDPCNGVPTTGRCTGTSGYEYCGVSTGTGQPELKSYTCPTGQACSEASGKASCQQVGACHPGDTRCSSTTQLQTCSNASAWTTQTCGTGTTCVAGSLGASCVATSGTHALSGTVTYETRGANSSRTDWSATVSTVPLPEVLVLSYSNGNLIDSTPTDANGAFTVQVPNAPTANDTVTLLAAGVDANGNITFMVGEPDNGSSGTFATGTVGTNAGAWGWSWKTNTLTNNAKLNITESYGSGAAKIFDYIRFAYNKALSVYGKRGKSIVAWLGYGTTWDCGACFATWPTTVRGFNFDSQVWFAADSNQEYWAESVTVHELGHWVMASYGTSPDEGGTHYVGNPTFPGQAWSEGWATFFSTASRQSPYYVDKQNGAMFWINVDTRTYSGGTFWQRPTPSGGLLQYMDENEVSSMLYKLSNSNSTAYNTLLTTLSATKMNRSPWARGYTRHTWDVNSSGGFTNVVDTKQSKPMVADFLDTLDCNGFSKTAIDAVTNPTTAYPYPSNTPKCQ